MSDQNYHIPNDNALSAGNIRPGEDLRDVDLSGATLQGANLADADLRSADLTNADLDRASLKNADLGKADLSEANMLLADLSGTNLVRSNLSKTELSLADLSGADLRDANLSEAKLRGADLSNTLIAGTTLNGARISRSTNIDSPGKRIRQFLTDSDASEEQQYDAIARTYHELKEAYSRNGLISQARKARVRERQARRREAKADESWQGTFAWIGSILSQVFTGYGVRLSPVIILMMILYLGSALIYWSWGDMTWNHSLYYSVVTFTTSPPETPPAGVSSIVAGIETFAGTASIVFLGYVLGTREQM